MYAPNDLLGNIWLWSHVILIRSLAPSYPWILVGDCNSICCVEEKYGGLGCLGRDSSIMSNNISFLKLVDMKLINGSFT